VPLQVMSCKLCVVFEVREAHLVPFELVSIVPSSPTATNLELFQITARKLFAVLEVRGVQLNPSELVRIVPLDPTATNRVPLQVMPRRLFEVPEVREVQVTPSKLVIIVPARPTTTTRPPFPVAMLRKSFPVGRGFTNFQCSPRSAKTGEVKDAVTTTTHAANQIPNLNPLLSDALKIPLLKTF